MHPFLLLIDVLVVVIGAASSRVIARTEIKAYLTKAQFSLSVPECQLSDAVNLVGAL